MRIFANANYNFIRWRWHALIGSIIIIWGGVGWIWAHGGMKYGIDFTGGTAVEVSFPQQTDEDVVRKAVDPISKEAIVQKYGAPAKHELLIRLPMMEGVEQGTALTGGDELMVVAGIYDHAARKRSYEILAGVAGLRA